MRSGGTKAKLGDVAEIITGYPFRSVDFVDDESEPRLCRGDNVAQGWLRWDGAKHWPLSKTTGLDAYWLRVDDVILAMDRPWIEAGLKFASVTPDDLPALLVQRVARLRGTSRLDTRFLRFVIASRDFTNYILGVQTGTAVPHISGGQIRSYEFVLPELSVQMRIAEVLCAIDSKISINRQINETLETMVRALFKSWFVDFEKVKMHGLVPLPLGWRHGVLEEIQADQANAITAGPFGSKLVSRDYVESGIPVIRGCNLGGQPGEWFAEDSFVYVSAEKVQRDLASCVARPGDVLFTQRGTLGQVGMIPFDATHERYVVSQSQMKMTCAPHVPPEFVILTFKRPETLAYIEANGVASGVPHINLGFLRKFPIVIPPPSILKEFGEVVRPLQLLMRKNVVENRLLTTTKDLLLPRLLSGELRVHDAERFVEASV